ncbi:MAG: YajQ family cyclic di-GMP-binding protein [Magnetococcales bacterium]|nr:YajQ family cyclic di-GMP-binding protein [Magnetococcales bacterium]MBF0152033.1 YajQ family cyclic di-GMP-binding protein [Magnetococcales bacterium]MBF0172212.1 YajQ family cyclic di-GMP-binding protein [Magnetococcales bacterium]MBF0349174.1 YajQ family cyclic di-GMP-binding protein [Magnetococcales bacterium]MBF0632326.1 YajQ family cyclic di-GMP-binding protein [Magnetococcales bacterium]
MPTFDIVSEVNLQEVDNAVNQTAKEIGTRYDFKGSKCKVEHEGATITIIADDDYKLEQVLEVLKEKLVRRKIETGVLDFAKPEQSSGNLVRQVITVKQGVDTELAKKICKMIKGSKLKVQAAIQGDAVRVTGKKRDDLQETIAKVKEAGYELPLQFINFRD